MRKIGRFPEGLTPILSGDVNEYIDKETEKRQTNTVDSKL